MMYFECIRAARVQSTDVPSEWKPCLSAGVTWTSETSGLTIPLVKSFGISPRKIGVKSARPSSIAFRQFEPVKSEFDRNISLHSGSLYSPAPSV